MTSGTAQGSGTAAAGRPPLATRERRALCDAALLAGPDAPTLCEGWTVRDLVAHLLVRERDPLAAPGLVVGALSWLTEREQARTARGDFAELVERVRGGPPRWSVYGLPRLDRTLNTLEFFVHHEDVRRAQPGWDARDLDRRDEALLWSMVSVAGKGLSRRSPVGLRIARTDPSASGQPRDDDEVTLLDREPGVVVRGRPSEVTLFVFGRSGHARVELDGPADAVARLRAEGDALGI